MASICFTFGPENSYFCKCPSQWSRNNLPSTVDALFTKNPPIKNIYDMVIGPGHSYYVGYIDSDNAARCMSYGLPPHLMKWLATDANGYVTHDIPTTKIALGPNGGYIAKDKNKMEWCGVPDALAARLNTYGASRTKLVTLGIDGTYVVVNTDGSGLRHLWGGKYTRLDNTLAAMHNLGDIQYLSLSLFPSIKPDRTVDVPLYMLVTNSGVFEGMCPDGHEPHFAKVTSALPVLTAPAPVVHAPMPQRAPSVHPPAPQTASRDIGAPPAAAAAVPAPQTTSRDIGAQPAAAAAKPAAPVRATTTHAVPVAKPPAPAHAHTAPHAHTKSHAKSNEPNAKDVVKMVSGAVKIANVANNIFGGGNNWGNGW